MKFVLELDHGRVEYGLDVALGWFGAYIDARGHEQKTYDSLSRGYDHERPLRGLLLWLGDSSGLFREEDLNEALVKLADTPSTRLPRRLRHIGEIVINLKRAADGS
jgi:hypothetical protein